LITHPEFFQLRLSQFFPGGSIAELENWEFMDRLWVGQAIGFSEWLCPEEHPETLQSLALDFSELPKDGYEKVLKILGLPLRPGMNVEEIEREMGAPFKVYEFVPDRKSYKFLHGDEDEYMISCTVKNEGGLSYLVVMVVREK
jgi:hypothetical protein